MNYSIPCTGKNFFSPKRPNGLLDRTQPSSQWVMVVKQPACEACHLSSTSAEGKNAWSQISCVTFTEQKKIFFMAQHPSRARAS
jgi:hypothetical protein